MEKSTLKLSDVRARLIFLKVLVFLMMLTIMGRLFYVQIIKHDDYLKKAESRQTMRNVILAQRGEIYMMDGKKPEVAVMNRQVWTVVVDPAVANEEKTKGALDELLKGKMLAEWGQVFKNKQLRYFVVARNVDRKTAEEIKKQRVAGVWLQKTTMRVYPETEMASGLLGFVNAKGEGQYGVEGALDKKLRGENGVLKTIKDINNIPLTIGSNNVRIPAVDGKNLVLSVDKNIQYATEKALRAGMERHKVAHASAIVMDPRTGKIWAMANLPNYNPADFGNVEDAEVYQNKSATEAYEVGSVCKAFTYAAAIDKGLMTPETTFTNFGYTMVDGWKIENALKGMDGVTTMQKALNYSFNTGSIQVLRWLGGSPTEITLQGKRALYDYYYNHFGLGQYTGVELAENKGIVVKPDEADASNSRYANMTFGQGLELTMLQVVTGFAALVNGGEYYTPTVLAGEMKNGELQEYKERTAVRSVVSAETSRVMRRMLRGVRESYAILGAVDDGYYVGGKTGTAQAVRGGKYVMDETIGSYVGFGAAAEDELPEYVIMTRIWDKGRKMEGGHAREIFDEISKYMLNYLKMEKKS